MKDGGGGGGGDERATGEQSGFLPFSPSQIKSLGQDPRAPPAGGPLHCSRRGRHVYHQRNIPGKTTAMGWAGRGQRGTRATAEQGFQLPLLQQNLRPDTFDKHGKEVMQILYGTEAQEMP